MFFSLGNQSGRVAKCRRSLQATKRDKVLRHFSKMAPFSTVDIATPSPRVTHPLPPKTNVVFFTLKPSFYYKQH